MGAADSVPAPVQSHLHELCAPTCVPAPVHRDLAPRPHTGLSSPGGRVAAAAQARCTARGQHGTLLAGMWGWGGRHHRRGQFTSCTSLPPPSFPQRANAGIGSVTLQPDPDGHYLIPPLRPEVAQGSAFWGLTRQQDCPTDPFPVLPPQPRPRKVQQGGSARRAGSPLPKARPAAGGGRELPAQQNASSYFPWKKCLQTPRGREAPAHESRLCCTTAEPRPRQAAPPRPHPVLSQAVPHSSHSMGPLQAEPHPRALWPLGLQTAQPQRPVQVPRTPGFPPPPRKVGPSEWGCSGATWRLAAGPGPLPSGLAPSAASKCGSIGICLPPAGVRPASPSPGFPARFLSKRTWESKCGDDS